ncbi:MAG: hypothetical protein ACI4X9_09205 [Kiritimatiellia bacterium]
MMRLGDGLNAFVGLWLVPRFVPEADLGALLPLTGFGAILGIPLSVLAIPLMKFLNRFMARGELGKVKALLRDACLCAVGLFGIIVIGLWVGLDWFLGRVGLANGRLGLMVLLCGTVSAFAPVATSALQGLKQFGTVTALGLGGAICRLVVMVVALPLRGVTGYFAGQASPSLLSIGVAGGVLWRRIWRGVVRQPYWHEVRGEFGGVLVGVAFYIAATTLQSSAESLSIRQALTSSESAGYYLIARFADLAGGLSGAMLPFLFPVAAEAHLRGRETRGILLRSTWANVLFGGLILCAVLLTGHWLSDWVEAWKVCDSLRLEAFLVCAISTLRGSVICFAMFEIACGRLRAPLWIGLFGLLEAGGLFALYDASDALGFRACLNAGGYWSLFGSFRAILFFGLLGTATQFALIPLWLRRLDAGAERP